MKKTIKTPISYYGGKQTLASRVIKMIPAHRLYCEPFIGGAAVFFSKPKSELEVINDLNGHIVTFYKVLKTDFPILRHLILQTPSSRRIHRESQFVLKNSEHFNDVKVAWAVWVQCNMSFASKMFAGYGYEKAGSSCTKKIHNKKIQFCKNLTKRLDLTDIECNEALQVIKSRDCKDAFFYVDPPYYNSDMGHYGGYTLNDFIELLELLSKIEGKFLLSSYPSEALQEYTLKNNWKTESVTLKISASKTRGKDKTEVFTYNYDL